jgi:glycosyltransferase involved in cell wall biosynthesis
MTLTIDRQQIGLNCINRIKSDFNWDKISSEYLRLFEHGLAQRVNS